MAKELIVYKKPKPAKGNIFARRKAAARKVRMTAGGIAAKASGQQKFLGKTLPKALFKTAKFAFKNPITATAIVLAPSAIKGIANRSKGLKFPANRQFNKRARKVI